LTPTQTRWRSDSSGVPMADALLDRSRLAHVILDTNSIGPGTPDQAHERRTAIHDLLEANRFAVSGHAGGPYGLTLSIREAKLVFDIRTEAGDPVLVHVLSLRPFRALLRDYLLICESHVAAIRTSSLAQIEVIDMGRRGLHNEGAEHLAERLRGKIESDFETMRRLFTLITALHWKG
jgi:uncharacterized protein (UPF0262 family)